MADKTVIAGSSVTASQLQEMFKQINQGVICREHMQAFLEHRDPFESLIPGAFDLTTFAGRLWSVDEKREVLPKGWRPRMLTSVVALKEGERAITGLEAKRRLAHKALLGVEAFWACWKNQDQIPEVLKDYRILFDGDVLLRHDGYQYSLCLYWSDGGWHWRPHWLKDLRDARDVSALSAMV